MDTSAYSAEHPLELLMHENLVHGARGDTEIHSEPPAERDPLKRGNPPLNRETASFSCCPAQEEVQEQ